MILPERVFGGAFEANWLVWHALLHDIGKPATRTEEPVADAATAADCRIRFFEHESIGASLAATRLEQLRFSRHEADLVAAVIAGHMRPHLLHTSFAGESISRRRASYRYFRDIGGRSIPYQAGLDTLLLALADYRATYLEAPPDWPAYLSHVQQLFAFAFESAAPETHLAPLVDGHMLMHSLQLQPGPLIGDLLDKLLEAQVAGDIHTPQEGLELAASWISQDQGGAT